MSEFSRRAQQKSSRHAGLTFSAAFGWGCVSQVEHLCTSAVRMADKLEKLGFEFKDGVVLETFATGEDKENV